MRNIATYIATGATAVALAITPAAAEKVKDTEAKVEDRVEMQDEQTLDQAELRGTKTKDNMITKHQKEALGADKSGVDKQNEKSLEEAELRGTKTKDNVITKHQQDVLDADKKDIDPKKADAKLDDSSNESADAGEAEKNERTSQAETETDTMSN